MRRGKLITIGSFDGVHQGHMTLLKWTKEEARKRKAKSLALTFDVPPKMILDKRSPLQLLSTKDEKELLLKANGIDEVKFLRFDSKIATLKPFLFFRDVLVRSLNARGIVVGLNFRFGQNRSAGAKELVRWGLDQEIPVWVVPPVKRQGTVVSSSFIRTLFSQNRFNKAIGLMGHPYLLEGKVVRGKGMGKKLGFPTANVKVQTGKFLPRGVFAVRARVKGSPKKTLLRGVCNIGTRPTIKKSTGLQVEAHFFNVRRNFLGKTLQIELVRWIRPEKRFPGLKLLVTAIKRDIKCAKAHIASKNQSVFRVQ